MKVPPRTILALPASRFRDRDYPGRWVSRGRAEVSFWSKPFHAPEAPAVRGRYDPRSSAASDQKGRNTGRGPGRESLGPWGSKGRGEVSLWSRVQGRRRPLIVMKRRNRFLSRKGSIPASADTSLGENVPQVRTSLGMPWGVRGGWEIPPQGERGGSTTHTLYSSLFAKRPYSP